MCYNKCIEYGKDIFVYQLIHNINYMKMHGDNSKEKQKFIKTLNPFERYALSSGKLKVEQNLSRHRIMASYVITGDTASLCNNLSLLFISKVGGVWGL